MPSLVHHTHHRVAYVRSGPSTNFGHEWGHDLGDFLGLVLLQPRAKIWGGGETMTQNLDTAGSQKALYQKT